MSRCRLIGKNPDQTVFVGIDPPFQTWFVQVHDEKEEKKNNGNQGYIEDINSVSRGKILETITKYANLNNGYTREVFTYVGLDLDPGNIP